MILEINNIDLVGQVFNGFDLHLKLIERGLKAKQLVMEKKSNLDSVIRLKHDFIQREEIRFLEKRYCVNNVLYPYADALIEMKEFWEADILHYHFPYHQMFSLVDYPSIMDNRAVWTIHDPWITTGNCTHALSCVQWKEECIKCDRINDDYFPLETDNVNFMWKTKKEYVRKINPEVIVSSNYMRDLLLQSPITMHFSKIHVIPFGIEIDKYKRKKRRHKNLRIGFRADDAFLKGCHILYKALRYVKDKDKVVLNTVGTGFIPKDIKNVYRVHEYGWINQREKLIDVLADCDVFVIPSLAESFCLMAIEAMAAGCVVICFKNTVVEEIAGGDECSISVKYGDSNELSDVIQKLIERKEIISEKQDRICSYIKRYEINSYVDKHIEVFKSLRLKL